MSYPNNNAPPFSTAPPNPNVGTVRSTVSTPVPVPVSVSVPTPVPIGVEVAPIVKRRNTLNICSLILRWLSFVFSFIAFVITVSNREGNTGIFEILEEYSYLLAIAIISSVYSAYQGIREIIQFVNAKLTFPQPVFAIIDFVGDQILAYLLISAASAAAPVFTRMNKNNDFEDSDSIIIKIIDMASASVSMAFLAFFTMALSVLISGFKLSIHFSI